MNDIYEWIEPNEYGNVDIRKGLPHGLVHIEYHSNTRLEHICQKMGVDYVPAMVGFEKRRHRGQKAVHYPIIRGVVVKRSVLQQLL